MRGTGMTPAIVSHPRVPGRSASRSCVPPPSAARQEGVEWQPGIVWRREITWEAGDPPGIYARASAPPPSQGPVLQKGEQDPGLLHWTL